MSNFLPFEGSEPFLFEADLRGLGFDNARAKTRNGLFEAEVVHKRGPWRSFESDEYATLEWVDWFNNR